MGRLVAMPKFVMEDITPICEVRFFAKVRKLDNGCWFWIPEHRDSKGRPRYRRQDAGQWAWLHFKGPYDAKIDGERSHTCETGGDCVNPDHMILETHRENMQRQPNPATKLTPEQVLAIRADRRGPSAVAAEYDIAPISVWEIRTRKTWTNI